MSAKNPLLAEDSDAALLHLLVKRSYLGPSLEKTLRAYMKLWNKDLFNSLVETHIVSEKVLADLVAELLTLPRVTRLSYIETPLKLQEILPFETAKRFHCIPIANDDELRLAHFYPVTKEFREIFSVRFPELLSNLCIAEISEIKRAIFSAYPLTAQMPNLFR